MTIPALTSEGIAVDWINRPTPYSGATGIVPDFVTIDDIPAATDSTVALGVGSSGPFSFDLDKDSPHVLVNAPTGLGKSAVARAIAVQRLSVGDMVIVLDRKMHSHRWARDLFPVVAHYADDVSSIGAALVNIGWELSRRNQVMRDWRGDPADAPIGPRIVVIFEETNATLSRLKVLDKSAAQQGQGALDAFSDVLFMGRAVKIHMVAFAQLASYRSGMTADVIENFGVKVMVGYSEKAWKWLARECGRYRPAPVGAGRGMVCHGNQASEVQLCWMPEESAAEFVLSSPAAQAQARKLSGTRRNLPTIWRRAIGR